MNHQALDRLPFDLPLQILSNPISPVRKNALLDSPFSLTLSNSIKKSARIFLARDGYIDSGEKKNSSFKIQLESERKENSVKLVAFDITKESPRECKALDFPLQMSTEVVKSKKVIEESVAIKEEKIQKQELKDPMLNSDSRGLLLERYIE